MRSVLHEIRGLRPDAPITVDYRNSNRYRVVVSENDGSRTAYYFSAPIYNRQSRRLVDMRLFADRGEIRAVGSDADIRLSQKLVMENAEGAISLTLPQRAVLVSPHEAKSGSCVLSPTTNGMAIRCDGTGRTENRFVIETGQPYLTLRANDRCVALMREQFRPLAVLSCIGALDAAGRVTAAAKLEVQKLTDTQTAVTVFTESPMSRAVLFEINLYENKLFQDTTVESGDPFANNAFGTVGFIGNSAAFGEQWLYARPDVSRLAELQDRRILKAVLHLPKLDGGRTELSAFRVTARFCSFGSHWNNKAAGGTLAADSQTVGGYRSLDVTPLLVHPRTGTLLASEGWILRAKSTDSGFSVITTGDSCFAPQILEVNYR